MSTKSVIIDAVRSPIGVKNGQLVGMRPDDLTAQVIKGLLARNEKVKPEDIEDYWPVSRCSCWYSKRSRRKSSEPFLRIRHGWSPPNEHRHRMR